MQIALAELPGADWNPWPTHGMMYLFCHDDEAAYFTPPSWERLLEWTLAGAEEKSLPEGASADRV